jgi:hypothetical protein
MTYFAVANETSSPILVEYQVAGEGTKISPCPDNHFIMKPKITDIKALNDAKIEDVLETTFACESSARTVRLELPPNKAVFLFQDLNYTGFRAEDKFAERTSLGFPIKSISVQGKFGKVHYEGAQVTRDFEKKKRTLYVLTYK